MILTNKESSILQECTIKYFMNDLPAMIKLKCGVEISINPIKVKDWSIVSNCMDILDIDKNSFGNIEIIQMSYLEFLYNYGIAEEEVLQKLSTLMKYCLNEDNCGFYLMNGKICLAVLDENEHIKFYFTKKDFDLFRKIVIHQNFPEYDDREVSRDVKELAEVFYSVQNNKIRQPSFEEQKTYVMARSGFLMNEINEMTYRTFIQIFNHNVDDMIYLGKKIIQGSYKYQVDEDIMYPLYEIKKDKYAEIFTDTSTLVNKGISGVEKLNMLQEEEN